MSVILKALRSQQEEGGADPIVPEGGVPGSFQVDSAGSAPSGEDPGAKKRQTILLAVLAAAIVLVVVLHFLRKEPPPPTPIALTPAPVPLVVTPPAGIPSDTVQVPAPEAPTTLTTTAPSEPNNDLQVARSQYKSGQFDDSLKSFQRALDKDPGNASIHNDMGLALLKKDLFTSAEGHFAKALELDDKCVECYNNLGYLKTALNQPTEAEKYLQKAIALKPDYPDPYFNLGVLYEKNGDIGNAVEAYQNFLKKLPKTETEMIAKIKSRIHDLSGE